jgi:hypothetical protein
MASLEAVKMKLLAASSAGGLSHDAVWSLGNLAESLERPVKRLEDILETLDPKDHGELAKLRRMKQAIENGPYLDYLTCKVLLNGWHSCQGDRFEVSKSVP